MQGFDWLAGLAGLITATLVFLLIERETIRYLWDQYRANRGAPVHHDPESIARAAAYEKKLQETPRERLMGKLKQIGRLSVLFIMLGGIIWAALPESVLMIGIILIVGVLLGILAGIVVNILIEIIRYQQP